MFNLNEFLYEGNGQIDFIVLIVSEQKIFLSSLNEHIQQIAIYCSKKETYKTSRMDGKQRLSGHKWNVCILFIQSISIHFD